MKRNKKTNKIFVEEALKSMSLNEVSQHDVDNAEKIVWNNLSQKINLLKNQKMESENISPVRVQKEHWYNYLLKPRFLTATITVILIFVFAVGSFIYVSVKNNVKNQPQDQLALLKEKANQRFVELMGTSYSELNALSSDTNTNNPVKTAGGSTLTPIDPEKAKTIIDSTVVDSVIFYSETRIESTEESLKYPDNFMMFPPTLAQYDKSQPITLKSWISTNYYKMLYEQNGKILGYFVVVPEFSIMYFGGKYAIKSTNSETYYYNSYTTGVSGDPELEFIKSILNGNTQYKDLGTKTFNGKTVSAFEDNATIQTSKESSSSKEISVPTDSTGTSQKTVYYIDINNFRLEGIEVFVNDVLAYRNTLVDSNKYEFSKSYFTDSTDLNNITIKTVKTPDYFTYKRDGFAKFSERHPLLVVDGQDVILDYINDVEYMQEYDEYYKTISDPEFSSVYSSSYTSDANTVANYYQTPYSITIYKTKDILLDPQNYDIADVTIKIDGKSSTAKQYTRRSDPVVDKGNTSSSSVPSSTEQYRDIVFQWAGVYYDVQGIFNGEIKFRTLTQTEAIDADNRINSYPNTNMDSNFDKLNSTYRYLPGDLSKNYNLIVTSAQYSTKKGSESNCSKYYSNLEECLIEKYDGFRVTYSENYIQTSDEKAKLDKCLQEGKSSCDEYIFHPTKSLSLTVLNAPLSKTESEIQKSDNYGYGNSEGNVYLYKEINGVTLIIQTSNLTKEQTQSIFDNVTLDKDLDVLKDQIKSQNFYIK